MRCLRNTISRRADCNAIFTRSFMKGDDKDMIVILKDFYYKGEYFERMVWRNDNVSELTFEAAELICKELKDGFDDHLSEID